MEHDQGLLHSVKKVLHSLLISSPRQVTIDKLKRDYFGEEGTAIPFVKLGFKNIESFLRSISDTVVVYGSGPMAIVAPITNSKSAHIQKLVKGQKKPKLNNTTGCKPTSWYEPQRSNLVFANQHVQNAQMYQYYNYQQHMQHFAAQQSHFNVVHQTNVANQIMQQEAAKVFQSFGFVNGQRQYYNSKPWQHRAPNMQQHSTPQQSRTQVPNQSNANKENFHRSTTQQSDHKGLNHSNAANQNVQHATAQPSYKQPSNQSNVTNHNVDQETAKLCQSLAGINLEAAKAATAQSLTTNNQVTPTRAESPNLHKDLPNRSIELLTRTATISTNLNSNADYQNVGENSVDGSSLNDKVSIDYASSDDCNGSDDDAIPAFALDERVFQVDYPLNAMRSDHKLPERDIATQLKVKNHIKVQLVKIKSPQYFNCWMLDDEYEEYKVMSENMQEFYSSCANKKYNMLTFLIMSGHLCAVQTKFGNWERAKIESFLPGQSINKIKVKLIDTGDTMLVNHSDIKYLNKKFGKLPPQYMRARLAYVTPWQGSSWSLEAINYFYNLVNNRMLFARIEHVDEKMKTAYLVLVNGEQEEPCKNINVALIESGWARRCYTP